MYMDHDGPPDTTPRGSSGYLPGGASGEKPAPTAAEVAAARYWFSGADPLREPSMGPTTRVHVAVLLAALDAAEAERKDAIGALDDAGVARNDDDAVASGIESLAADRYEFSDLWTGVCDLFWPDREPDDCFGIEDVREAVEEREQRGDAAEAREKAAYRDGWDANVEASREILTRAETAERERDEARAAGFREGVAVTMEAFHAQLQKINVGDILAALKEAPRG